MLAGTSGIRSACNSVGKALWSKTTGGSLLDKGASVRVFYKCSVLAAYAWPLVQVAPCTCQRNNPFRWSYVVKEDSTTASFFLSNLIALCIISKAVLEEHDINVVQKGEDWWLMSKHPALPEMSPVGQRMVRMQFPKILKVVHKDKEEAELEAEWLRDHLKNWGKKLGKRARKQSLRIS